MSNTGRRTDFKTTKEKMKETLKEEKKMAKKETVVPLKKNLINTCLYFQSFSSILRYLVFSILNFGKNNGRTILNIDI